MRRRKRKYGEGHLVLRGKQWYLYYKNKGEKVKGRKLGTTDEAEAHILADLLIKELKEASLVRRVLDEARPLILSQSRPNLTMQEKRDALLTEPGISFEEYLRRVKAFREDDEAIDKRIRTLGDINSELEQLERDNPKLEAIWEKCQKWIQSHRRPNTLAAYVSAWKAFRKYILANRVGDLSPSDIDTFITKAKEDGIGDGTISHYIKVLSSLFNIAFEHGHFKGRNVFAGAKFEYKPIKEPNKFLTVEQRDKFLELAKRESTHFYLFVALCVHAGLRPGEAVNQRWEEIDFERKILYVRSKKANKDKGIQEFVIKDYENRSVPVKNELLVILTPYRQAEGYVYVDPKRPALTRFNFNAVVQTPFKKVREEAGIDPVIVPHALRHTFGSLLSQSGVSIHKIAEWMGHADVNTTARIYAHLQAYDPDINRDPTNGTANA